MPLAHAPPTQALIAEIMERDEADVWRATPSGSPRERPPARKRYMPPRGDRHDRPRGGGPIEGKGPSSARPQKPSARHRTKAARRPNARRAERTAWNRPAGLEPRVPSDRVGNRDGSKIKMRPPSPIARRITGRARFQDDWVSTTRMRRIRALFANSNRSERNTAATSPRRPGAASLLFCISVRPSRRAAPPFPSLKGRDTSARCQPLASPLRCAVHARACDRECESLRLHQARARRRPPGVICRGSC